MTEVTMERISELIEQFKKQYNEQDLEKVRMSQDAVTLLREAFNTIPQTISPETQEAVVAVYEKTIHQLMKEENWTSGRDAKGDLKPTPGSDSVEETPEPSTVTETSSKPVNKAAEKPVQPSTVAQTLAAASSTTNTSEKKISPTPTAPVAAPTKKAAKKANKKKKAATAANSSTPGTGVGARGGKTVPAGTTANVSDSEGLTLEEQISYGQQDYDRYLAMKYAELGPNIIVDITGETHAIPEKYLDPDYELSDYEVGL